MTARAEAWFPPEFFWGGALSAHCVEGNDDQADWWHWEQRPGRIADGTTSHPAADFLQHGRQDVELAARLGHNALFLALSWPRVNPAPGAFDAAALARYRTILEAARARGITPIVALQHVTLPAWLRGLGGWTAPGAVEAFLAYTEAVVAALGASCQRWVPVYEPEYALLRGAWREWMEPAQGLFPGKGLGRALRQLSAAETAASGALRAASPGALVGVSVRAVQALPEDGDSLWDHRAARRVARLCGGHTNGATDPLPRGATADFVALSYFGQARVRFSPAGPLGVFARPAGGGLRETPSVDGFAQVLERAHCWGKPVYLCGIGAGVRDDPARVQFLLDHLWVLRHYPAVRGYLHYALLDGWEWTQGHTMRYGLVHVDPATQTRTPNVSAFLLRDIIEARAITPGIVQRYAPGWTPPEQARPTSGDST